MTSSTPPPTVSVIVSTYSVKRANYVLDCLKSLKNQTFRPIETVLVLDPSHELRSFYAPIVSEDIIVLSSEQHGLSNARNAGAQKALGDIVAFIDDDARAHKDWLKNLVRHYGCPDVKCVGGRILPLWDHGRPKWFPEELDWIVGCTYKGLPEVLSCVRNPIGCNMSFRKDVFLKVGYFRSYFGRIGETLLASEEAEFSIRVVRQLPQSKILFDPAAIVYHRVPKERKAMRYFLRRSFYEGCSKRLLRKSNLDDTGLLSLEQNYLKYLIGNAMLQRLGMKHGFQDILEIISLLASISMVLTGYAWARLLEVRKLDSDLSQLKK